MNKETMSTVNVKSFLKSAPLAKLLEIQEFLSAEIENRKAKPQKMDHVITFTDGAARGNPGPSGIGVLIFDGKGEKIMQDYSYLGECTNNEAEYRALLLALDHAYEITHGKVECFADSELMIRQLNGQYAVKSEKLAVFHGEVKRRAQRFESIRFTHVPREHPNLQLADKLANKAIDEFKGGRHG